MKQTFSSPRGSVNAQMHGSQLLMASNVPQGNADGSKRNDEIVLTIAGDQVIVHLNGNELPATRAEMPGMERQGGKRGDMPRRTTG